MNQNNEQPDLAIAFVPFQKYGEKFPIMEALQKGTLFVDLYRSYNPEKGWDGR